MITQTEDQTKQQRHEFWAAVDRAVEIVESWPAWKREACRSISEPYPKDWWDDK